MLVQLSSLMGEATFAMAWLIERRTAGLHSETEDRGLGLKWIVCVTPSPGSGNIIEEDPEDQKTRCCGGQNHHKGVVLNPQQMLLLVHDLGVNVFLNP